MRREPRPPRSYTCAMSRSFRKTPILGHTTARSEADDKRAWHQRWRARVRAQLAALKPGDDAPPVHRNEVSSTWDMSKDGKQWLGPRDQEKVAERIAIRRGQTKPEQRSLRSRLLAKWRSK